MGRLDEGELDGLLEEDESEDSSNESSYSGKESSAFNDINQSLNSRKVQKASSPPPKQHQPSQISHSPAVNSNPMSSAGIKNNKVNLISDSGFGIKKQNTMGPQSYMGVANSANYKTEDNKVVRKDSKKAFKSGDNYDYS